MLGPIFADFLRPYDKSPLETAVYISWTGLLLGSLAWGSRNKSARRWVLFTLLSMLISLGPTLKILGEDHFTEYDLPIVLPFAFLTALPGFDFWRTPGRFMIVGFTGLGIAASFGLTWLQRRLPNNRLCHLVVIGATVLLLVEDWPQRWPQEVLPPTPQFYQRIGEDEKQYGVFDLPIRPCQPINYYCWYIYFSSYYELDQMVHGKGIASGYTSRNYHSHPVFPQFISDSVDDSLFQTDVLVNGTPTSRYTNARYELARNGYRYVVYHKPQAWYPEYQPGAWGEEVSQQFIEAVFGQQAPIVDDELVTVYEVAPITDTSQLVTTIALEGKDWVRSPATFYVASPRLQLANLEITLADMVIPRRAHVSSEASWHCKQMPTHRSRPG
jgi:hypothetical protein